MVKKAVVFLFSFFLCVAISQGCSVLSESQISSIEALTIKSDTMVNAPSAIFHSLNHIRVQRGIFYTASLGTPENRIEELDALAKAKVEGEKRAAKADTYVNVLSSYIRAVRSLASDERSEAIGREFRGIGNNIDSVIISYNILVEEQLPVGISKLSGKTLGYLAENLTKGKQFEFLKEFMTLGDSLVAECCDTLISILKDKKMDALIQNEKEGLENNFKAFLYEMERLGQVPPVEYYNEYLILREKSLAINEVRNASVRALRYFKNAHHKIVEKLSQKQEIDITDDILELTKLTYDICLAVKKI